MGVKSAPISPVIKYKTRKWVLDFGREVQDRLSETVEFRVIKKNDCF